MSKSLLVSNPFALMMNPDEVLHAMQASERLRHLQRRICKPLDKPVLAKADAEGEASDDESNEGSSAKN